MIRQLPSSSSVRRSCSLLCALPLGQTNSGLQLSRPAFLLRSFRAVGRQHSEIDPPYFPFCRSTLAIAVVPPLWQLNSAGGLRSFSSAVETGDVQSLDQETEKKAGWLLKALAAATFTYVGLNVYPLMGDSLVKQSVALLRSKDPMFRRSGASRLTLIATDDQRRLKIVDAGGVGALVNMLEAASDDNTRREAAKALATLSACDAAVEALHKAGVQPFVDTLSTSSSDLEIQQHSLFLLERLKEWRTRTSQ